MSQIALHQVQPTISRAKGNALYRMGAIAALLAVAVALADIVLTFFPAGAQQPGTMTAVDWFELFHRNWFFGLRNLGLLPNILSLILLMPLFFALYAAHRHVDHNNALLALGISLVGTAIYLSNNAAFPMLTLSTKYAAATTEAQRSLLAAAGEAILAHGEDFTPGVVIGLLLGEIAILTMALVMLRNRIFSRATAYTGILGSFFLSVFTVWTTFIPVFFELAMLLALLGGLLSIAWYILTARRLFQLGAASSRTPSSILERNENEQ